ncbi:MAG: WhiB family transcriptional regulator [Actinobacteria bacterium]|nr:WhiB family transcriptional regulator [Actinomycetota bacterium]
MFLWARDAACNDLEPEDADALFFPERGHGADKGRALCRRCPVAKECLEFATAGVEFGV